MQAALSSSGIDLRNGRLPTDPCAALIQVISLAAMG